MRKTPSERIGAYGLIVSEGLLLLIEQEKGPFANRFDFPGGKIEPSESPEEALSRELMEEIGAIFQSASLLTKLTSLVDQSGYYFSQIGLLYEIQGAAFIQKGELKQKLIDPNTLRENHCSALLWQYLSTIHSS